MPPKRSEAPKEAQTKEESVASDEALDIGVPPDAKVAKEAVRSAIAVPAEGLTICEAFDAMRRGKRVRREGWSAHVKAHLAILRGHTLPSLVNGRAASPYLPSVADVMADDWQIVEGGENG